MYRHIPRLANLLLVLGSIFVALLAIEISLRFRAHLENRGLLASGALSRGVELPAGRPAELGHIIRLSSEPKTNPVGAFRPPLPVVTNSSMKAPGDTPAGPW